jgi:WD40 repeat protein
MRPLCAIVLSCLAAHAACAAAPPAKVPAEVLAWIDQLGSKDGTIRDSAAKKLRVRGEGILPVLRAASRFHADVDVRLRILLVVSSIEGDVYRETFRFTRHEDGVTAFALSPDGKRVASAAARNVRETIVRVWEVATGKELFQLEGNAVIECVAWSKDGKHILTGANRNLFLWDARTGKRIQAIPYPGKTPHGIAFAPDGKKAVCLYGQFTGFEVRGILIRGKPREVCCSGEA